MTHTGRDRRCWERTLVAAVAAATALGLAACSVTTSDQPEVPSGPRGPAGVEPGAPQFDHVHGMGVDPGDGTVYVATHDGLFRAAGGPLTRVGTSGRDLMGFTITGPKSFLSSGHPGPGEQAPNPLGVIRSEDAGATWSPLGLAGEVDFHALEVRGGVVYGYDATNRVLRASSDGGRSWSSLSELLALDITAEPSNPAKVLATVPGGVAASVDGGRSFNAPTGPQLVYLSWAADGVVYGIGLDGALFASTDRGMSWQQRGTAPGGRPQALTAISDPTASTDLLIATAGGLFRSQDAGRSVVPLA